MEPHRWYRVVESSPPESLPFLGLYREVAQEVIARQRAADARLFWPPGLQAPRK